MQYNYIEDIKNLESAQSVKTYINNVELKKCAPDVEGDSDNPNKE